MFHVVEFYKENPVTVAVVPKTWVVKTTKGGFLCYWPRSGASQKARKGFHPDKEKWQRFSVKVVDNCTTSDYEKALRWAKRAETQLNVNSSSKEQLSRPHVLPARFRHDSDSDTTQIEDGNAPKASGRAADLPRPPHYHGDAFTTRVLTKMDQILEAQQDLRKLLSTAVPARGVMDPLPKASSTEDQLQALCSRLTREDQYREQLITFLALDGASTLGKTVRRMMSRLGTTALWFLYSMRGRKKKSFGDLPLLQVLVKACTTCHPGIRIVDVEREVAEFLKHAPFKKGGSGKVGKANPSALVSDDSDGPDTNSPGQSPSSLLLF
ncbi:hypothetical protein ACEWY4_003816 [Coilia grayii]|uniref:DUF4806 domain-containing protein n=1 Tax=Coilia grayii TaxID=363190 RepID=A0ABD1KSA4_9TELE